MSGKRGRKELTYEVLDNAQILVKKIVDSFPDLFFEVNPDQVLVVGIQNDPPASKSWLARIKNIRGIWKTLAEQHKLYTKFVIEIYTADYNSMNENQKAWIILHELLHITTMKSTEMFKHNVQDFSGIIKKIGPNAYLTSELPDLFKTKFDDDFVNSRRSIISDFKEKEKDSK
jgi:predicted metallopeptidase